MLKILVLTLSTTLLPLSIFAGTLVASISRDLPPLQVDSRSDGARQLVFGAYRGLA